jgi:hypothetical protein
VLLHEDATKAKPRGDGRDLARVVRLHAADRDEGVAPLRKRVRGEVLEFAHLVAAVREAGVAVLAFRPDVDLAAEVFAQALEPMYRRRSEEERDTIETLGTHWGDPTFLPTPDWSNRAAKESNLPTRGLHRPAVSKCGHLRAAQVFSRRTSWSRFAEFTENCRVRDTCPRASG